MASSSSPRRSAQPSPLASALATLSSALDVVQSELGGEALNGQLVLQRENDELKRRVHELEEVIESLTTLKSPSTGSLSPTTSYFGNEPRSIVAAMSSERSVSTGDVERRHATDKLHEERSVTFDETTKRGPGLLMRNLSYCARVKADGSEGDTEPSRRVQSLHRSQTERVRIGEEKRRTSNMGVVSSESASAKRADGPAGCGFRLLLSTDELCEFIDPPNGVLAITHQVPTMVKLVWRQRPQSVLLVKKPRDPEITAALTALVPMLKSRGVANVFVEVPVYEELQDAGSDVFKDVLPFKNAPVSPKHARSSSLGRMRSRSSSAPRDGTTSIVIDFIISLGGDGTVIWVSNLFPKGIPPVVSFSLGSLGFLTPHEFRNAPAVVDKMVKGGFELTLRARLQCTLWTRSGKSSVHVPRSFNVLNEIVIDRGPSSYMVLLNLSVDSDSSISAAKHITNVQGDGLIIGTPTGSTAYSLAAGGSMVHPGVPTMVVTPICPHSLSFRPILMPDAVTLKVTVPETARGSAYVAFDGRQQTELKKGDYVTVKMSRYPLPAVCKGDEHADWLNALNTGLNFNLREVQKAFENKIS